MPRSSRSANTKSELTLKISMNLRKRLPAKVSRSLSCRRKLEKREENRAAKVIIRGVTVMRHPSKRRVLKQRRTTKRSKKVTPKKRLKQNHNHSKRKRNRTATMKS